MYHMSCGCVMLFLKGWETQPFEADLTTFLFILFTFRYLPSPRRAQDNMSQQTEIETTTAEC